MGKSPNELELIGFRHTYPCELCPHGTNLKSIIQKNAANLMRLSETSGELLEQSRRRLRYECRISSYLFIYIEA